MKWALVTTVRRVKEMWYINNDNQQVYGDVACDPGTICNIVAYTDGTDFDVPEGCELKEVPDSANIGDTGHL